jgi:hypothetical protein
VAEMFICSGVGRYGKSKDPIPAQCGGGRHGLSPDATATPLPPDTDVETHTSVTIESGDKCPTRSQLSSGPQVF